MSSSCSSAHAADAADPGGQDPRACVFTAQRLASLPDVPTDGGSGFGRCKAWFGMFAPAGTPAEVIAWVNRKTGTALAAGPLRERYLSLGTSLPLCPHNSRSTSPPNGRKWGDVIRQANIRLE